VPLIDDRAQLLEKYGPYVRSLANSVRKQFGARLDIEDLVAYGNIGLFEASERFDAKLGANFLTFAHYRIKGAIFDGLRKMGILKGPDQRAAYLSDRTNAYMQAASASDSGGRPHSFADDVNEVAGAVTGLATVFATSLAGMEHLQIRDESMSPEERLELSELKELVRRAIEQLPENEKKLLLGYYYQGLTLEEAGQGIGQSKSWASRLHARAIERIKAALAEDAEARAKPRKPVEVGALPKKQGPDVPRAGAQPRPVTR
jgi:RNA polymerase sigma factor for flagellar operon FliA